MGMIGKRLKKAHEGLDAPAHYPVEEAVKLIKERATAKFDETIEISMNLSIDPRHADRQERFAHRIAQPESADQHPQIVAEMHLERRSRQTICSTSIKITSSRSSGGPASRR